jgi:hypothetical protein
MRTILLTAACLLSLFGCGRSSDPVEGQRCQWRLGPAVELARGDVQLDRAGGAVHATADVALVIASTSTEYVGVLVTTDEQAERIASMGMSHGYAHSTESGFVLSSYPNCRVEVVDANLASSRSVDLGGEAADADCLLSQSAAGRIEVAVTHGLGGPTQVRSWTGLGSPEPVVEELGAVGAGTPLRVVHQPGYGTWVWMGGPSFALERLDGAAPTRAEWPTPGGLKGATADPARGGIVLLPRRDGRDGWGDYQLEWFGPEGSLSAPEVTPLPEIWPFEQLVGVEDGAFIPLHGGTLAFVRWGERSMETLRHDESERVLQSRAIVRPGGDRGGLVYTVDEAGESVLKWRSLVCVR